MHLGLQDERLVACGLQRRQFGLCASLGGLGCLKRLLRRFHPFLSDPILDTTPFLPIAGLFGRLQLCLGYLHITLRQRQGCLRFSDTQLQFLWVIPGPDGILPISPPSQGLHQRLAKGRLRCGYLLWPHLSLRLGQFRLGHFQCYLGLSYLDRQIAFI